MGKVYCKPVSTGLVNEHTDSCVSSVFSPRRSADLWQVQSVMSFHFVQTVAHLLRPKIGDGSGETVVWDFLDFFFAVATSKYLLKVTKCLEVKIISRSAWFTLKPLHRNS